MGLKDFLSKHRLATPDLHVVLGSGYSAAYLKLNKTGWDELGELKFSNVESLPQATVEGHPGKYVILKHKETGVVLNLQLGRLHGYEGIPAQTVVQTVLEGVRAGTRRFILTNASGGLSLKNKPGSVMVLTDHINLTGQNPLTGPNLSGPRFPDMSNAYDDKLSRSLLKALKKRKISAFTGVYAGLSGPNYETPAEVQLLKRLGLGAVGMSTVWETLALSHAGAKVAGCALITNFGAGLKKTALNHEDVLEQAAKSARTVIEAVLDVAQTKPLGDQSR